MSDQNCFWCKRQVTNRPGGLKSNLVPYHVLGLFRTRDHKTPKSQGGRKTVCCCFACNNLKANKSLIEWGRFMKENPNWWDLFGNRARPERMR